MPAPFGFADTETDTETLTLGPPDPVGPCPPGPGDPGLVGADDGADDGSEGDVAPVPEPDPGVGSLGPLLGPLVSPDSVSPGEDVGVGVADSSGAQGGWAVPDAHTTPTAATIRARHAPTATKAARAPRLAGEASVGSDVAATWARLSVNSLSAMGWEVSARNPRAIRRRDRKRPMARPC